MSYQEFMNKKEYYPDGRDKKYSEFKTRCGKQWTAEREVLDFLHYFVKLIKPTRVLEIGTFEGDTAFSIGTALLENGEGTLITTDVEDYGQKKFLKTLGNVMVLIKEEIPDLKFDLIFIDDGHTYEEALRDLEKAHELLTSGGYIIGHDYYDLNTGVMKAVSDFLEKHNHYDSLSIKTPAGLFILRKLP